MKTLLLALAAASLVACSAAAAPDEATQGAAIESANAPGAAVHAAAEHPLCIYSKGHPVNGVAPVWLFDGEHVLATKAFYWHDVAMFSTLSVGGGDPVTGGTDLEVTTASLTLDFVPADHGIFDTTVHQAGQDDIVTTATQCVMVDAPPLEETPFTETP